MRKARHPFTRSVGSGGATAPAEDFAFRIFNCGLRIISRDLQALSEQGVTVPLRSQQRDIEHGLAEHADPFETCFEQDRPEVCPQLSVFTQPPRSVLICLPKDDDDALGTRRSQIPGFVSVPSEPIPHPVRPTFIRVGFLGQRSVSR